MCVCVGGGGPSLSSGLTEVGHRALREALAKTTLCAMPASPTFPQIHQAHGSSKGRQRRQEPAFHCFCVWIVFSFPKDLCTNRVLGASEGPCDKGETASWMNISRLKRLLLHARSHPVKVTELLCGMRFSFTLQGPSALPSMDGPLLCQPSCHKKRGHM